MSHHIKENRQPDPADIAIGANVRRIRKLRSLSQERLAEQLGKTFQQVQKYESGVNRISGSVLLAIARALSVRVQDLFPSQEHYAETLTESLTQEASEIDRKASGLLTALSGLDRRELMVVKSMVDLIAVPAIKQAQGVLLSNADAENAFFAIMTQDVEEWDATAKRILEQMPEFAQTQCVAAETGQAEAA